MASDGGPDIQAQLLQMQSLIASSRGGGAASGLCGGFLRDVDVGAPLSLKSAALKSEATFQPSAQGRPGMPVKLLKALGLNGQAILEDCKKAAQGVSVVYSGNITNGAPTISNAPMDAGGHSSRHFDI